MTRKKGSSAAKATKLDRDIAEYAALRIVPSERAGYAPGKWVLQYLSGNGMWFDIGDPKTKREAEAAQKRETERYLASTHHLGRKVHQGPTGREVYAAHERGGHITTSGRRSLPREKFALPPGPSEKRRGIKGRLPLDTIERAHAALTRASQMHHRGHISARELSQARKAVRHAWPSIHVTM